MVAKDTKVSETKTHCPILRNLKSKKEDLHSGEGERHVNFTGKWWDLGRVELGEGAQAQRGT